MDSVHCTLHNNRKKKVAKDSKQKYKKKEHRVRISFVIWLIRVLQLLDKVECKSLDRTSSFLYHFGFHLFPGTPRQVFHGPLAWSNLLEENILCLNLSLWPPRLAHGMDHWTAPPFPIPISDRTLKIHPILYWEKKVAVAAPCSDPKMSPG